jgi:hypothetical protein
VVPVRFVASFTAAHAGAPTKSTLVSLTMPLSTFLGVGDQPGRLDGYGPIPAGLARRIATDAAKDTPTWTAWRCIVTDDVHGTVLGVTDPIWTPRHDPPPRLKRLVTAMEPVCVFPGCRLQARRCDLDHRIPYDPDDPAGERGGGRTCSCNMQALCRTHHQQKTAGLLKVRAVTRAEDPSVPLGTLEWTLPSGVTCRSHPYIAGPAPIRTDGPGALPEVAAATRHQADQRARRQAWLAANPDLRDPDNDDPDNDERRVADTATPERDWAEQAWRHSREQAAQARADQAADDAEEAERKAREADGSTDDEVDDDEPPF